MAKHKEVDGNAEEDEKAEGVQKSYHAAPSKPTNSKPPPLISAASGAMSGSLISACVQVVLKDREPGSS
eukprot:1160032-Pelagomonas_calceolata.AAC.2